MKFPLLTSLVLASDPSLHWGTYRPNLYFGTKTRSTSNPLLTGLMWTDVRDGQSIGSLRHECNQGDNLDHYAWEQHDGRSYGKQNIHDSKHNVKLATEFVKSSGGDWSIRVSGEAFDKNQGFYFI